MSLEGERERLVREFEGIFSPETVTECLEESALALSEAARIQLASPPSRSGSRVSGSERSHNREER